MIDSTLSAGCLLEVLHDFREQELEAKKYFRWVMQGGTTSYEEFWRMMKNGRRD